MQKPILSKSTFIRGLQCEKSLYLYKKVNANDSIGKCNLEIFDILQSQNKLKYDAKPFLDEYYEYGLQKKDSLKILISYFRYAEYYFERNPSFASNFYHKAIKYTNKQSAKTTAYGNLALLYTTSQPDSARFYFKKNLELIDTNNKEALYSSYLNFANFFQIHANIKVLAAIFIYLLRSTRKLPAGSPRTGCG